MFNGSLPELEDPRVRAPSTSGQIYISKDLPKWSQIKQSLTAKQPDEGLLQTAHFPRFSIHKIPSPTTDVVPPLPLGEGFESLILLMKICQVWQENQAHSEFQTKLPIQGLS